MPCAMGFPIFVGVPCGVGALVTSGRSVITVGIVVHPGAEGPGTLAVFDVFDWLCVGEYEGAGGVGCGVETTGVEVGVDVAVGVGVEVGATTILAIAEAKDVFHACEIALAPDTP